MIDVRAERTREAWHVTMAGHAMQGPAGQDIVCAAASMLLQACVYGLRKIGTKGLRWQAEKGGAELWAPCGMHASERVEAMLDGLELLAAVYPQAVRVNRPDQERPTAE